MQKLLFCLILFSCTSEKNDIVKEKYVTLDLYTPSQMKQIWELLKCESSLLKEMDITLIEVKNNLNDSIKLWTRIRGGDLYLNTNYAVIEINSGLMNLDRISPTEFQDSLFVLPPHSSKIFRTTDYVSPEDNDICFIVAPEIILPVGMHLDTPINSPHFRGVPPIFIIYKIINGQFEDWTEIMTDSINSNKKEYEKLKRKNDNN